jgi:molecular chaperone GrpE
MSEEHVDLTRAPAAGGASGSEPLAPVATADAHEHDAAVLEDDAEQLAGEQLERLAAAEAKRDEYLADLQRLAADFDNYRKRAVREQQAFAARAHERLIAKLLPVLDDLERALDAAEHHEQAKLIEGVELTRAALASALASEGLVEIEAEGAFDPHAHEALMTQPVDGVEPGQIVQVVQRGYRLGDVVLRPVRVIVAAAEEG